MPKRGQRDRDAAGRPRNARPRDAAGRPLPRGSTGAPEASYDAIAVGLPTIEEAQRLIERGEPFAAHEVLEAAWKNAVAEERDLWQGLAQLAVGLTHAQRGNATGATALLRRGAERIAPYGHGGDPPYGVPIAELVHQAHRAADDIEEHGLPAGRSVALRLR